MSTAEEAKDAMQKHKALQAQKYLLLSKQEQILMRQVTGEILSGRKTKELQQELTDLLQQKQELLPQFCHQDGPGGPTKKAQVQDLSNAMGRWLKRKMWKLRFELLEEKKKEKKVNEAYLKKITRCRAPFYPELHMIPDFYQEYPLYIKEKNWPKIEDTYPTQQQLTSQFQLAKENFAIVIGLSEYQSVGDTCFLDLKQAKNDVKAIKNFLLESYTEFRPQNILSLINPSHEQILQAMQQLHTMVEKASNSGPTNVFVYYSGHGTSLNGKLHISCPTVLAENEYASLKHDLSGALDIDELRAILVEYTNNREKVGINFKEKKMEVEIQKMTGLDMKAVTDLKGAVTKMLEVSEKLLEKLKPIDPLNIVKKMTAKQLQVAKLEFAKALIQEYPEEFSKNDFLVSLTKALKYLFNEYARYINIDLYVEKLGRTGNVNLISLFDCCRERPATRYSATDLVLIYDNTGTIVQSSERHFGMSANFYAKQDGELAAAGSATDELSPTTKAWLYYVKANAGASYPQVLSNFQFSVLNRCDNKINTLRNIIFVPPNQMPWNNTQLCDGLQKIVTDNFNLKAKEQEGFISKIYTAIAQQDTELFPVLKDSYAYQRQQLSAQVDYLERTGYIGEQLARLLVKFNDSVYVNGIQPSTSLKKKDFQNNPVEKILFQMFDFYKRRSDSTIWISQFVPFANQVLKLNCGDDLDTLIQTDPELKEKVQGHLDLMNLTPNNKIITKKRRGKKVEIKVPYITQSDFFNHHQVREDLLFLRSSQISYNIELGQATNPQIMKSSRYTIQESLNFFLTMVKSMAYSRIRMEITAELEGKTQVMSLSYDGLDLQNPDPKNLDKHPLTVKQKSEQFVYKVFDKEVNYDLRDSSCEKVFQQMQDFYYSIVNLRKINAANYCRAVMDKLIPEETADKEVKNKLLLEPRILKDWHQIGGAWCKGEMYQKENGRLELHGRGIIVLPNIFVLVATFNHNRIEKNYFHLRNNIEQKDFQKPLAEGFQVFVNNGQLISSEFLDNAEIMNVTRLLAHPLNIPQDKNLFAAEDDAGELGRLQGAVEELYFETGKSIISPQLLGKEFFCTKKLPVLHYGQNTPEFKAYRPFFDDVQRKFGLNSIETNDRSEILNRIRAHFKGKTEKELDEILYEDPKTKTTLAFIRDLNIKDKSKFDRLLKTHELANFVELIVLAFFGRQHYKFDAYAQDKGFETMTLWDGRQLHVAGDGFLYAAKRDNGDNTNPAIRQFKLKNGLMTIRDGRQIYRNDFLERACCAHQNSDTNTDPKKRTFTQRGRELFIGTGQNFYVHGDSNWVSIHNIGQFLTQNTEHHRRQWHFENEADARSKWKKKISDLTAEQCLDLLYWNSDPPKDAPDETREDCKKRIQSKLKSVGGFKFIQNGGVTVIADYTKSTKKPEGRAVVIVPGFSVKAFKIVNNRPVSVNHVEPSNQHKFNFQKPFILKRKYINEHYLNNVQFYRTQKHFILNNAKKIYSESTESDTLNLIKLQHSLQVYTDKWTPNCVFKTTQKHNKEGQLKTLVVGQSHPKTKKFCGNVLVIRKSGFKFVAIGKKSCQQTFEHQLYTLAHQAMNQKNKNNICLLDNLDQGNVKERYKKSIESNCFQFDVSHVHKVIDGKTPTTFQLKDGRQLHVSTDETVHVRHLNKDANNDPNRRNFFLENGGMHLKDGRTFYVNNPFLHEGFFGNCVRTNTHSNNDPVRRDLTYNPKDGKITLHKAGRTVYAKGNQIVRACATNTEDNNDPNRNTWIRKFDWHHTMTQKSVPHTEKTTINYVPKQTGWYKKEGFWTGEQDKQGRPHGRVIYYDSDNLRLLQVNHGQPYGKAFGICKDSDAFTEEYLPPTPNAIGVFPDPWIRTVFENLK